MLTRPNTLMEREELHHSGLDRADTLDIQRSADRVPASPVQCAPDTFAPRIAAIRTRVNRRVFNRLFPKRHFRLPCLQAGVLELSATDPDRTRCR